MNLAGKRYVLFESPEEIKITRIELTSGRGGYHVKMEQVNQSGKCLKAKYFYRGKIYSQMPKIVSKLREKLITQGIEAKKIEVADRTYPQENAYHANWYRN